LPRKPKLDALAGSAADKLIDAAVDIQMNPDAVERSYMARQLVQCTLPHSDPGDVSLWSRTNGHLTLAIRPYVDLKTRKHMYPYGSIPRLLLFWLVTEATQKKSRRIRLGNSLDAFMREIGLNPRTGGGKRGDAARLQRTAIPNVVNRSRIGRRSLRALRPQRQKRIEDAESHLCQT
jgi:hypothetical protein